MPVPTKYHISYRKPFKPVLNFDGHIVLDQFTVNGPLTFTVGPDPEEASTVTVNLVANGVNTPVIPGLEYVGSSGWNNTAGVLNVVTLVYQTQQIYYSINQYIPPTAVLPPVNPAIETLVNFTQRTIDLLQDGTSYRTAGVASHFSTYAVASIRMLGDGYFISGVGSTASLIMALRFSSDLQAVNNADWVYRCARYGPTGGCVFNYGAATRGSFATAATEEIRIKRTGITVTVESKLLASPTWTVRYTYPETFSGTLWPAFSLGTDTGTNSLADNLRTLGAA